MNPWLTAAAMLAAITTIIHLVLGGRDVVRPLMASTLPEEPKLTLYLCWHVVTIVLAGLTVCFLLPALGTGSHDLAWVATTGALLLTLWNGALIALFRLSLLGYPQWALFGPMAALGFLGLL